MPRTLTAAQENAARAVCQELVAKELLPVPGRHGRPRGLAPIAAAMALRDGDYVTMARRSNSKAMTLAAKDFGCQVGHIQPYMGLLEQLSSGAQPMVAVDTPAAVRARLVSRSRCVSLSHTSHTPTHTMVRPSGATPRAALVRRKERSAAACCCGCGCVAAARTHTQVRTCTRITLSESIGRV